MKSIHLYLAPAALLAVLGFLGFTGEACGEQPKEDNMNWKLLSPFEHRVLVEKDTEPPFTGKLLHNQDEGVYRCKRCDAALFSSSAKFDSGCGWPSFDQALPGAVREVPDRDGRRVEILCASCGAHLGHVFRGEGFTPEDTRHCVNSVSLEFSPGEAEDGTAYFAGGCFWGVEHLMAAEPGVISVESGYMGGWKDNPTYEEVCTGATGHAETVKVVFNPSVTSYEKLTRVFLEIHDPTQRNGQGPDLGYQYRSEIFYNSEAQRQVAQNLLQELRNRGYGVVTLLEPADRFWKAESYHQDYYKRTGKAPYCHFRTPRFK